MAKIISFIMAVFTAVYMFVSCGKIPDIGITDTTAAPSISETEHTVSEKDVSQTQPGIPEESKETEKAENTVDKKLELYINGEAVPVTWENNNSVSALEELSHNGLSVDMSMYGGFEQVGSLGASLPHSDRNITTSCGDIVLYQGNQIVIFYGSNSWSYTPLGHINLSRGEITRLLSGNSASVNLKYE